MRTDARPQRTMASVAAALVAAMALSGCGQQVSWNQKLTVTVQTPDGVKTGSAVQRVRIYDKAGILEPITPVEARGVADALEGEAVVVDLGENRYLFMLVGGASLLTQRVLEWPRPWFPDGARAVAAFDGVARVPRQHAPQLVTFANIDAPQTVARVDPGNLSASFGPGHRLLSITLEITDEPVIQGRVEEVLGWLKNDAALDEAWQPLNHDARTAVLGLRQPIRKNR